MLDLIMAKKYADWLVSNPTIADGSISSVKLKTTTDADKIQLANLSTEVTQAMAGTTPVSSTPADGSVTDAKVSATAAILPEKIKYIQHVVSGNLVDPTAIETGRYYDTNGTLQTLAGYSTTGLIPVKPSTAYTKSTTGNVTYWDASQVFISGANAQGFTTPANAAYVRSSLANSAVATYMLVEGSTLPGQFIPYKYVFKLPKTNFQVELADNSVTSSQLQTGISGSKLKYAKDGNVNLINPNFPITGKYYAATGVLTTLAGYASTDLIEVSPGVVYKKNFSSSITYWGANGAFVSGQDGVSTSFTVPNNANIKYLRSSVLLSFKQWTLVKGDNPSGGHIPYSEKYALPLLRYVVDPWEPNAKVPLFIETIDAGGNQPIHPKVITFASAWNGYKYWMAYSPYPDASSGAENPSIAASNDLIKWVTPTGLTNPLVSRPDGGTAMTRYNSDPHLVYNSTTNEIECWYREVYDGIENIKRVRSTNGTTWTAPELLMTTAGTNPPNILKLISPTVLYENTTYKLYVMVDSYIKLFTSADATNWTDAGNIKQNSGVDNVFTWHFDIMYNSAKALYEMINNENGSSATAQDGILTHYTSTDGVNWTKSDWFMRPSYGTNKFDNKGLYRGTLVYINSRYYLVYTGVSTANKWCLGLSISSDETLSTLKGTDSSYKPLMTQPTKKNPMGNMGDFLYEATLNKVIYCVEKAGVKTWVDASGVVI